MFNWAVERGELETSPMDRIALPKGPDARDRYLDDGELAALWRATLRLDHAYAHLIRALILLGQRRDEVADMTWEEVDLDRAIWTIPGARTKNAKPHMLPLARQAIEQLKATGTSEGYLFSASGAQPIQNWSYWKRKVDKLFNEELSKAELPVAAPWKVHDLRRSVASGMQRLGEHRDVVEAFSNRQVREGVAAVYQRHDYRTEMEAAAQRWADHVEALLDERAEAKSQAA
jgi:integrase